MTPEPTPFLEQTPEQRRADLQAHRLELAEGNVRAARRALEAHEQTPEMQTLRTLERIEKLLVRLLDASH